MDMVLSLGLAEYANRGTPAADPSNSINRVKPLIPPELATICGLPIATPVACPVLPIMASVVSELLHAALLVKSAVLPSLKVPFAANCTLAPIVTEGTAGVTWMAVSILVGGGGGPPEDEPQPPEIMAPIAAMTGSVRIRKPNRLLDLIETLHHSRRKL